MKRDLLKKLFDQWYEQLTTGEEGIFRYMLCKAYEAGYEQGKKIRKALDAKDLDHYKLEVARLNKEVNDLQDRLQETPPIIYQ